MKNTFVKTAIFALALVLSTAHTFAASYADVLNGEYQNDPFFANNSTDLFDDGYLEKNALSSASSDVSMSANTIQGDLIGADSTEETIFYVVK